MPYHILLIDDDPYFRSEFKEFMSDVDVIEAADAESAWRILKRPHNLDLIILDEMLVGERGTQILPQIRKLSPDIDIIILTGYSSKDVAIDAIKAQATDFIEKPLTPQKLKLIKSRIYAAPKGQNDDRISGIEGKIERAKYFAQRNYDKKLTLNDVSEEVCLSPKYLSRIFKEHTGSNFSDYRLQLKILKAKNLLQFSGQTIDQISAKLGYENPDSFIKVFKKYCHCTPNKYRTQIKNQKLQKNQSVPDQMPDMENEFSQLGNALVCEGNDAIIEMNSHGKILLWTPSAQKCYGWQISDASQKNIKQYSPASEHKEISRTLIKLRKGEKIHTWDTRRITRTGKVVDVCVTLNLKYDTKGKLQKIVSVERGAHCPNKEKAQWILKTQKARQHAKETKNELQRVKNILKKERYLSEIGKLSSIVAHELRNPLNVIQTAVWNIKKKNLDPKLQDNIKSIERKICDSEAIIDNLLKYARIKAPDLEKVRIASLIDECVESMERKFRRRKPIINRRYKHFKNTRINVDPLQFKQILNNLLSNAYEALKGRQGCIELIGRRKKGGYIEIRVRDNGPGIPPQFLNKIFDPFFSRRPGGTGLGLAVCKQLIEMHKGEIYIESIFGKGTTTVIRLPLDIKTKECL